MARTIHNQRIFMNTLSLIRGRSKSIFGLIGMYLLVYAVLLVLIMASSAGYYYLVGNMEMFQQDMSHLWDFVSFLQELEYRSVIAYIWRSGTDFPGVALVYAAGLGIIIVVATVIMDAWRYTVYHRIVKQRPALTSQALWHGIFIAPTLFIAHLIYGLGSAIGFMLLIVPAFVLYLISALYPYVIVDSDVGPFQSLVYSYQLMQGHIWSLFQLWLIGSLIAYTPLMLVNLVYDPSHMVYDQTVTMYLILPLVYIARLIAVVWTMLILPLCTAQYYQILHDSESHDNEHLDVDAGHASS